MRGKKINPEQEAIKLADEALKIFRDAIDANAVQGIQILKLAVPGQLPTLDIVIHILPSFMDKNKKPEVDV